MFMIRREKGLNGLTKVMRAGEGHENSILLGVTPDDSDNIKIVCRSYLCIEIPLSFPCDKTHPRFYFLISSFDFFSPALLSFPSHVFVLFVCYFGEILMQREMNMFLVSFFLIWNLLFLAVAIVKICRFLNFLTFVPLIHGRRRKCQIVT